MGEALWWANAHPTKIYVELAAVEETAAWWATVAGHHGRKVLKDEEE